MNDNLQNVLSELAEGLGTSTGELWSWMRGNGIESYAKVRMARLWVEAFESLAVLLLCVLVGALLYRFWKKNDEYFDLGELILLEVIPFVASALFALYFMETVSELAGWMASPEGMVIEKFLEMVK